MFRSLRGIFRRSNRLCRRRVRVGRWPEQLEPRQMLSVLPIEAHAVPVVPLHGGVTNGVPVGFTPSEVRNAYGFDQVTFVNGTVQGNGQSQTIAIVDAYDDPRISSDLQTFDQAFGLPAPPSFVQVNQNGGTRLPSTNSGWSLETALDVEWAHAIAPAANIKLVDASNASLGNLLAAVNYARQQPGVVAVSMSWGASEFSGETGLDSYFTTPSGHAGVAFVAASGDGGAGTIWPAVSPNVVAVGGTTLTPTGSGYNETGWSGSGGGYSAVEPEPSYQNGVQSSGARTTPDVAYNADPNTGFAVFDSVAYAGQSGWFQVGGTSAGAPQWAALIAIADQGRAAAHLGPLANVPSDLYSLSSTAFHDITSGSNGAFTAAPGYDLVTGLGSPVANVAIAALVASNDPTPAAATVANGSLAAHHGAPPSTATVSPFVVETIVAQAAAPSPSLPSVLVQPAAATTSATALSVVTNVLPAAEMRPMAADTSADRADILFVIRSPSNGGNSELTTLLGGEGRGAASGTATTALWSGNGCGSATLAATGQRSSTVRAGATPWEVCQACFGDDSWTAVSWDWVEPLVLGLGEISESMPHPALVLLAAVATVQGYTRFRSDSKESSAAAT